MFRWSHIQKILCSESPMFRNICSEDPIFRDNLFVRKAIYPEGPMFRRSYIQ